MKSTELLCKAILEELNNDENKNIILISGASASGKSYTAEKIVDFLTANGKKSALLSADNYYKGLSKIIISKALLNKNFQEFASKFDDIHVIVRSIIEDCDFANKFSTENVSLLNEKLKCILGDRTSSFIEELINQKNNIDFDEPFAVDFDLLSNDINKFTSGDKFKVPNHSFITGETSYDGNIIDGQDTEVLVVEGIYTLRDEILDSIDYDKTIKCAINCDTKTLMSRRFNRDIRQGRTSFSPEQTITSFITKVMPSYYRYIRPSMMYADYTLDTSLTLEEKAKRVSSRQYKFRSNNAMEYLKKYKAKLLSDREEIDYFLEDENTDSDIILRLRSTDGKVNSLCFKMGGSVQNRTMDEYPLTGVLGDNLDIRVIIDNLKKSGFNIVDMLRKTRKEYLINDMVIKLDDVDDIGEFIEIDASQFDTLDVKSKINEIKMLLRLEDFVEDSYIAIQKSNTCDKDSVESERKYKLDMDKTELRKLTKGAEKKKIKQYYLDMYNSDVQRFLAKTFNRNIQFKDFGEARIRFVNDDRSYVTMKSRGKSHRIEWEKEIPVFTAEDYLSHSVKNLSKTRYIIHKDEERGLVLELDAYKKAPLIILEVEYDAEKENAESIREYVNNYFSEYEVTITDVTSDRNYKNKNLANELSE